MKFVLIWNFFALFFSALLPLVNPLGSALLFVGIVGPMPIHTYHRLARRIAINVFIFFIIVQLIGAAILNFFGVSLPIVEVSGGLVIAAMGWSLLNQQEVQPLKQDMPVNANEEELSTGLIAKAFYPLTFPLTVGPGSIVVTLTLSAKATQATTSDSMLAHAGIVVGALIMSFLVYLCYANAPRITAAIQPATAHGILRVIAFFLLCIGVQITWNGLSNLLHTFLHHT
jgi:multiple antibiotic resistance protein